MQKNKDALSQYIRFGLIRLYKNDLLEIIKILSKNLEELKIEINDYILEENEISKFDNHESYKITLSAKKYSEPDKKDFESIRIYLHKDSSYISISNIEVVELMGVAKSIEDILRKNEKLKIAREYLIGYLFSYGVLSAIISIFIVSKTKIGFIDTVYFAMGVYIILMIIGVYVYIISETKHSKIFFCEKDNVSLFNKHKRRIWDVILVLIGVIATLILQKMFS
ncbi:MAG: hypothetical protein PHN88_02275 [Ignavibacteria bacterium]|nr:hypothetical protein [Ignavibacteria bacterium]